MVTGVDGALAALVEAVASFPSSVRRKSDSPLEGRTKAAAAVAKASRACREVMDFDFMIEGVSSLDLLSGAFTKDCLLLPRGGRTQISNLSKAHLSGRD
jgi:hypothetical protein